jgi:hypothetical protein
MAESYENADLETLRAMARGRGIDGAEDMEHDDLVDVLREAGLAEAGSKASVGRADEEPGSGVYHAKGVGRRETISGAEQ